MTVMTLLADPALDTDRLMLEGIDTTKGPLYSVSEMARFFFARSSYWARWLDTCHYDKCPLPPAAHDESVENLDDHRRTWKLVLDGELLSPVRTASNARKYDLALIEKIAHALALNSTIKPSQLRQALLLVRIQAQMAGYLQMKMAVDTPPDLEQLLADARSEPNPDPEPDPEPDLGPDAEGTPEESVRSKESK